eukprot:TRINITY_DN8461_c0_g1_i3.p1 TRINITY_DN8461_c0_g1~~TRINITY_DN8461_c0_g1_i3.p1  ORF type:complete len:473 (+),score=89.92 TRINITY_DN8461_c0_g1_i3:73-1491(+)
MEGSFRDNCTVTVYWHLHSCLPPTNVRGFQVVSALRNYARSIGVLKNISVLGDLNSLDQEMRQELHQSGVLLNDFPLAKPSSVDMAMMVEFLKFTCDNKPPHHLIFIGHDPEFASVLNVLVFRSYDVTLIHNPDVASVLRNSATHALDWIMLLSKFGGVNMAFPTPIGPSSRLLPDKLAERDVKVPFTPQEHPRAVFSPAMDSSSRFSPLIAPPSSRSPSPKPRSPFTPISPRSSMGPKLDEEVCQFIIDSIHDSNNGRQLMSLLGGFMKDQRYDLWDEVSRHGGIANFVSARRNLFAIQKNSKGHNEVFLKNFAESDAPSPYASFEYVDGKEYLDRALKILKRDYLLPIESSLKKVVKSLFRARNKKLTEMSWKSILDIAITDPEFVILGNAPTRVIYPSADRFDGVDPNFPLASNFTEDQWTILKNFLIASHPVKKNGRHGFALFLKEKGPPGTGPEKLDSGLHPLTSLP